MVHQKEVSSHQRREPCMAMRGAAWQSKVRAYNSILYMDGILLIKLPVQCAQYNQAVHSSGAYTLSAAW